MFDLLAGKHPAICVFVHVFVLFQLISSQGHAADKIRLAVPDVGGQFITYPLAHSRGFLKQEGIDARMF